MFGIDFSEILVIFLIALVVLGPQKLPRLAAAIGRWVGRARSMARQFREQLEQEAHALEKSAELHTPPSPVPAPQPAPADTSAAAPPAAAAEHAVPTESSPSPTPSVTTGTATTPHSAGSYEPER